MKDSANKKEKENTRKPLSTSGKLLLCVLATALVAAIVYFAYYFIHYINYSGYKKYLTTPVYESAKEYAPLKEDKPEVPGMELVAESENLKLYTDTATGNVAVYDKRNQTVTYSNPLNADDDTVANTTNLNYLKSQLVVYYYNSAVKSGIYDSFSCSVQRKQYTYESIENGVRYIFRIGDLKNKDKTEGISFEIPLEYRLYDDCLEVNIPAGEIKEYGNGKIYRIQLLRYLGAPDDKTDGYFLVPNGSGSLIHFNNGKLGEANYSQYIYDIDPVSASYTTTENSTVARLALYGICEEKRSILATIEDSASLCVLTAGISGNYSQYNYAFPSFVLRTADNLKMFGNSSTDVFVLESDLINVDLKVRYSFLTDEYTGYNGLCAYYRNRLTDEGILAKKEESELPFYMDVITGVQETAHIMGAQYLKTAAATTFKEAEVISGDLKELGISNQVVNLQGWFNDGYYHNPIDRIHVESALGGKKGLASLNETVSNAGGRLYADAMVNKVPFTAKGYNYPAESSRYYGAGYAVSFGQTNPTTLSNNASLGYLETRYNFLSPKFLPRYMKAFSNRFAKLPVYGVSLRDMANTLSSDKKRTEIINREEALDINLGAFEMIKEKEIPILASEANDYSFAYVKDIINAPLEASDYYITDETVPFYEMLIHGCIDYSSPLINFCDSDRMNYLKLLMIETGAAPHYVFTYEESNMLKNTSLSRYYSTTYDVWKESAADMYLEVSDVLSSVTGAFMVEHETLEDGVKKVSYDNGVTIYVNYTDKDVTADGLTVPAGGYLKEGR